MLTNRLSARLGVDHALVQGPFGGGMSSPALTAAVSNAGGLGSYGAMHLDAAGIRRVAGEIRALTDRPFALNLWIPRADVPLTDAGWEAGLAALRPFYAAKGLPLPERPAAFAPAFDDQVAAMLEARPAVFSFVFGVPTEALVAACRERGIVMVGAATNVDEAVALERAGVDAVVASGAEAGGHRPAFLHPPEEAIGLVALVPQVVDAVTIPVIAAGGIADGRGVVAAIALGASGVQVGTAFLACRESNATDAHRLAMREERARHTRLTRAFSGRLARGIPNGFMDALDAAPGRLPFPAQNWATRPLRSTGDPELVGMWAGQGAPLVRGGDAREVFGFLVADARRVRDAWG